MKADVPVALSTTNTARFPYLEPLVRCFRPAEERRSARWLMVGISRTRGCRPRSSSRNGSPPTPPSGRSVQPVIVQATGDSEASVGTANVRTCANVSDGALKPDDKHSDWQILALVLGLN